MDFDSASDVEVYRFVYTNGYHGTYVTNPSPIRAREGIWIYSNSAKNYYFPGSATSATEPDSSYISTIKSLLNSSGESWALIGTGRDMYVNLIRNNFSDYFLYENGNWVYKSEIDSRNVIYGGSGVWVKK